MKNLENEGKTEYSSEGFDGERLWERVDYTCPLKGILAGKIEQAKQAINEEKNHKVER